MLKETNWAAQVPCKENKKKKRFSSVFGISRRTNRPIARAFNVKMIENRNYYGPLWLLYSPAKIKIH